LAIYRKFSATPKSVAELNYQVLYVIWDNWAQRPINKAV